MVKIAPPPGAMSKGMLGAGASPLTPPARALPGIIEETELALGGLAARGIEQEGATTRTRRRWRTARSRGRHWVAAVWWV